MRRGYALAAGRRLREVRLHQGLTLQAVDDLSEGRWRPAVVGSYERGDRMISVASLRDLAGFYQVPVSSILTEGATPAAPHERGPRIVLNLDRLADAPPAAALLRRWVERIRRQRDDYAGRVLSIRYGDLTALAVLHATTPAGLTDRLRIWGVLDVDQRE